MNGKTILETLKRLDETLSVMEKSMVSLEKLAFAQQRDLFGGWISGDTPAHIQDASDDATVTSAADTALLNIKLDAAIGRIQQILHEAA